MLRFLVIAVILCSACVYAMAGRKAEIRLHLPDLPPLQHALQALMSAFQARGMEVAVNPTKAQKVDVRIVAGIAGKSPAVDALLREYRLTVAPQPESLLIHRCPGKPLTLLLAGADARGLMYAMLETAEAVRLAPKEGDLFANLCTGSETPALQVRSLSVALQNADLERGWYFDEAYWNQYFAMLARDRYNSFLLRFADQTNYLAPPFPWLFDLPEYPAVAVGGLTKDAQARNLAMLRRIGELATAHGIDFGLAIWQQQPVLEKGMPVGPYVPNFGPTTLANLPSGAQLADYSTKALARLLQECPTIRSLQLRVNYESGIPEKTQHEYFQALFSVLKRQTPPVRLDLRYKGLEMKTVTEAEAAGLPVAVSTKFWCEHMGLPFHPTTQDPIYSPSRYGYGTMLKRPRNYQVTYQLWNHGSNRLLLWGDPRYAARFAESCLLGDGTGYEVFAPLSNRGWGNEPGAWRLLSTPAQEYYRWEYERYWLFYLAFARMGYNPQTSALVWKREFAARFGAAAADVEQAYLAASQILPLITASGQPSASEWSYWPEMDLCGSLETYSVVPPSDYGQFYGIRTWKAVNGWNSETWSSTTNGFVEDAIAGKVEAKWTPFRVSAELDRLATVSLTAMEAARKRSVNPPGAELRATEVDMQALAYLARYHAAKKRAATHLAFFHATNEAGRLVKVYDYAVEAANAWEALARVTDGVYTDNLVFGRSREQVGTAAKPVNAHAGHWKDRLPNVQADVAYAHALLTKYQGSGQPYRVFPGEVPPAQLPRISHTPVTTTRANADIHLIAQVDSPAPLQKVLVYYRPMDQTKLWTAVPMQDAGNGQYQATISSKAFNATYDLLYYIEARIDGGGTLWPNWTEQAPYCKVVVTP